VNAIAAMCVAAMTGIGTTVQSMRPQHQRGPTGTEKTGKGRAGPKPARGSAGPKPAWGAPDGSQPGVRPTETDRAASLGAGSADARSERGGAGALGGQCLDRGPGCTMLGDEFTYARTTLPAATGHAQFGAQVAHVLCAVEQARADASIRDIPANADNHFHTSLNT